MSSWGEKNELEMTNLVIWQRPAVKWLTHPNEMANGKINDGKLSSFTPMQPQTNPYSKISTIHNTNSFTSTNYVKIYTQVQVQRLEIGWLEWVAQTVLVLQVH